MKIILYLVLIVISLVLRAIYGPPDLPEDPDDTGVVNGLADWSINKDKSNGRN